MAIYKPVQNIIKSFGVSIIDLIKKKNNKMNILSKIVKVNFPQEQYIPRETNKTQIVLHHTVSGRGINGDISTWLNNSQRIATHIIVDWKGIPHQCYSSKYWAYHLGVKEKVFKSMNLPYQLLDDNSIGIEIDSYGGLTKKGNEWFTVYGNKISNDKVYEYDTPYRGYKAYEKYTDEQIQTVKELLVFWNERYNIPLDYNEDMWDISTNALQGKSGVWSHTSYRSDKSDIHPQKELVDMLKSLS